MYNIFFRFTSDVSTMWKKKLYLCDKRRYYSNFDHLNKVVNAIQQMLFTYSLTHLLTCLLHCVFLLCIIMPPSLIGDAFVWRMSVWRLSVVYIGPNSRTQRPRKTKIGTEVGHVTCDPDTTFKVKRSKVKVTRPLWLVVLLAGKNGHTVMVSYPYACMTYIVSPLAGLGGGISATAWF